MAIVVREREPDPREVKRIQEEQGKGASGGPPKQPTPHASASSRKHQQNSLKNKPDEAACVVDGNGRVLFQEVSIFAESEADRFHSGLLRKAAVLQKKPSTGKDAEKLAKAVKAMSEGRVITGAAAKRAINMGRD